MSFGLSEIKADQLSKSYFYNRVATNYEEPEKDHSLSELFPLLTSSITPIDLTNREEFLSGIEFAGKVILDTPVFRWEGITTFYRDREDMWDDLGTIDRERVSMWFAEYAINEASDEVFGAEILEGVYNKLRYCSIQHIVYSQKIKIYVSDIVYRLSFSPDSDWEGQ